MTKKITKGFSLIETIVVLAVFSLLAIVTTQTLFITVRNSKKSSSSVNVRENIDYAISIIERHLRNAKTVIPCPNSDTTRINYYDTRDVQTTFSCESIGNGGYIASGSARLTNEEVEIASCVLTCSLEESTSPYLITVEISAKDKNNTTVESGNISVSSRFNIRATE